MIGHGGENVHYFAPRIRILGGLIIPFALRSLCGSQVKQAVDALYAFIQRKAEQSEAQLPANGKLSLFSDDADISITIALKKTPEKGKNKPVRM